MLKLAWHVGDVLRKLRDMMGLTQGALGALAEPPLQPNTVGDIERQGPGYQSRGNSRQRLLVALNVALAKHFDGQIETLTEDDLQDLIPIQRRATDTPTTPDTISVAAEAIRHMDPRDRDVILMMIETFVTKRRTSRTTDTEASDAQPHGDRDHDRPPPRPPNH
jgi:hypothetical protein